MSTTQRSVLHRKVFALTALTLIVAVCTFYTAPKIETDIRARVEQDLSSAKWASIEVDGRTVYIRGKAPAGARALARRRLKGVFGVGRVVNLGNQ